MQAIWESLPDHVRSHVNLFVGMMQEAVDRIEAGKRADRMTGGQGRYEFEQYQAAASRYRDLDESLNTFREIAAEHGLDGDAILVFAGKPELPVPGAQCQEWLDELAIA